MPYRPRILVIDSSPEDNASLCAALAAEGYTVESAPDGRSGLRSALTGRFGVVIADRIVLGLSGVELCQQIRRADLPNYLYVMLLCRRWRSGDVVEALDAGANECIGKPVARGELLARLRTAQRVISLVTRDVTIFALAKLAESRDPETGAHLERVRHYSSLLAQGLQERPEYADQINDEFVRLIFLTSPLHDIGKVGIPDAILLKPGRLTDAEFATMMSHTTIGADTLEAVLRVHPETLYLQMAREIALTHHERFDGRGYPLGLSGREIPLAGRIVALADAYDALTCKRVYRDAYTHEFARTTIINERGGQFDPDVVDVFLDEENRFTHIRRRFSDGGCAFELQRTPLQPAAA